MWILDSSARLTKSGRIRWLYYIEEPHPCLRISMSSYLNGFGLECTSCCSSPIAVDDSRTGKLGCLTRVQVAALVLEVRRVHARLGTLGEFNYRMSEEDIRLSWKTMDYPSVRLLSPDSTVVLPLRLIFRPSNGFTACRP